MKSMMGGTYWENVRKSFTRAMVPTELLPSARAGEVADSLPHRSSHDE